MKPISYDFNTNTIHLKTTQGTSIEITDALTKAQIKKIERTAARRLYKLNGKNGMRVK